MQVDTDNHLIAAGEIFMFLCLVESTMRDFVVLKEGDKSMRDRYNEKYGKKKLPKDFARKRLAISRNSFGKIKNRFLEYWPEWKSNEQVLYSIERAVIYRNGFGHANIQPFRQFLLYTPTERMRNSINEYIRCPDCFNFLKACNCSREGYIEPQALVFRCLDSNFVNNLYQDIQIIDVECFLPTAQKLDIAYKGIAWPTNSGYEITENFPGEV